MLNVSHWHYQHRYCQGSATVGIVTAGTRFVVRVLLSKHVSVRVYLPGSCPHPIRLPTPAEQLSSSAWLCSTRRGAGSAREHSLQEGGQGTNPFLLSESARSGHCSRLVDVQFRLGGVKYLPEFTQPAGGKHQWEPKLVCLWIPRSLPLPSVILNLVHAKVTIRRPVLCSLRINEWSVGQPVGFLRKM